MRLLASVTTGNQEAADSSGDHSVFIRSLEVWIRCGSRSAWPLSDSWIAICVIAVVGAMPVLVPGRTPDGVPGADFHDGLAFALRPAAAGGDNQDLAQRMCMPGRTGAGLESGVSAGDARRIGRRMQRVDTDRSSEVFRRAFDGSL